MKLLYEILYLISLAVLTFPSQYKILGTKNLHYFPRSKKSWMMWCGVLVYRGEFDQWSKDKTAWMRMNIRLYQAKTYHSSWLTFYFQFWLDMLIGSLVCGSWRGGFFTSPYIIEEYVKEDSDCYLSDYKKENMEKYHFSYPERRLLWKEVGGDIGRWLKLIKEV